MKNLKKTHFLLIAIIAIFSFIACDNNTDELNVPSPLVNSEISDLVGTWDKRDSVRLSIKPDGNITAQRWIASASSYANNFAVVGNIKRNDNNYTITVNKSNLAHLWSSQTITKIEGVFELNTDKTTIKFKSVKVYPENLDVSAAVIKRLSNTFIKNINPTTLLPLEEITFADINTFQPAQVPNIKPWSYTNGQFHFSDTNYSFMTQTPDASALGIINNAMGQHIHVIVDNAPYAAAMTKDYTFALTDGQHRIAAFASKSYHESYKNSEAIIVTDINILNGNETSRTPITTPEMFCSRPKGNYNVANGDTNKILIDYMINDVLKSKFSGLGSKYLIRTSINQTPYLMHSWKPMTISGLNRIGSHKLTLDLYDTETKTVVKTISQDFTLI